MRRNVKVPKKSVGLHAPTNSLRRLDLADERLTQSDQSLPSGASRDRKPETEEMPLAVTWVEEEPPQRPSAGPMNDLSREELFWVLEQLRAEEEDQLLRLRSMRVRLEADRSVAARWFGSIRRQLRGGCSH